MINYLDSDIVQTWLSNNEARRDLIAHPSTLNNLKAKFIINLALNLNLSFDEQSFATQNATLQYTHIYLPYPATDELAAMKFLSCETNKQSDEAYSTYRSSMDQYLRRTRAKGDFWS